MAVQGHLRSLIWYLESAYATSYWSSQCSTVVRNCCKSGSKMLRKTPILDPRSSVTPDAIDLKFGRRDYVVGGTQHAKTQNNRPSRGPPAMG